MTALLETRRLGKSFALRRGGWRRFVDRPGRIVAVDGVDLRIAAGEALGVVGESGCGKSTLARLIARLIAADAGEILLDGAPIHTLTPRDFARSPLRARVQMAFQDPADSLAPHFTARRAIADPATQLLRGASRAEIAARVARAVAQVGLGPELLDRLPHQLSGGQAARVGLARAMVAEPALLVLDEPTAALDASSQALVLKLLARLRAEAGVALLLVSHDLGVVRLLCDRIAVMYRGQIVESGPARAVLAAPAHPYARALIDARPRPPGAARARAAIADETVDPDDPDTRLCRFLSRCPIAQPICRRAAPPDAEIAPGRRARCHCPLTRPTAGS